MALFLHRAASDFKWLARLIETTLKDLKPLQHQLGGDALRFDLLAKVRHDAAEFRNHGLRVGQLVAKHVDVVGRRHARFNTAAPSG